MNEKLRLLSLLETYGVMPNRALGQNFCIDSERLRCIAEAADVSDQTVLEIGSGFGALTDALITAGAKRIVAIEKDKRLAEILRVETDDLRLKVVAEDFLEADIAHLLGGEPFVACGNLPYYITTPIVEKLLCCRPLSATLMVQKEAAIRFFAAPSARVYGPLTVLANTFYSPVRVMDVPRSSYYPVPAVDSCVVQLRARADCPSSDPEQFLVFLKQLFSKRRKTIKNNVLFTETLLDVCAATGIDPSARAESLSPQMLLRFFLAAENIYNTNTPELIRLK